MAYTRHIAGEYDEETKLQLCVLCGKILIDWNGVIWVTTDKPPGGWSEGQEVFIDGGFRTRTIGENTEFIECLSPQNNQ